MRRTENTTNDQKEQTDSPSPHQAQFDTLPQQVAEERQCMVQLHLFVVESQAKGHGAHRIPAQAEAQKPPQCKAQAHSVVPATVKANIVFPSKFNKGG